MKSVLPQSEEKMLIMYKSIVYFLIVHSIGDYVFVVMKFPDNSEAIIHVVSNRYVFMTYIQMLKRSFQKKIVEKCFSGTEDGK